MGISNLFSQKEKNDIKKAIEEAELNTSGEIRVHIESNCKKDPLDRASEVFSKLQMHKTELRNGVLFYVAVNDHKFAIIGDVGINTKVPNNFWDDINNTAISLFKKNKYAEGLSKGVEKVGNALKEYFPYQKDDINELSDDISFGD
jgi:uncharacterized membrane protein